MKTILIVEDNQDNMDLFKEILEEAEYRVFGTSSAENGIEVLKRGVPIDLILMDISLPNLNGYDATRIIKSTEKFRKIPVVMLTANASQEDREKGIEAGCDEYLTKPVVDEEAFLAVIESFISKE